MRAATSRACSSRDAAPSAPSEVSRICATLDTKVEAFRGRALDPAGHPYLWLDALYHKVHEEGRVVNMATLIAIGVSAAGERSVLGVEVAAAGGDEGTTGCRSCRASTRAAWSASSSSSATPMRD